MREIKFRCWGHQENLDYRMFNQCSLRNYHGAMLPYFLDDPICDHDLMQYTGLKDKKGVDIYEGDICKVSGHYVDDYWQAESTGKVEFENGCYMIADEFGHELCEEDIFNHCFEIIGNVHENPELLTT